MCKKGGNAHKHCILYERECISCGECDRCDLNPDKICDSCGKCISSEDAEFREYKLSSLISENSMPENFYEHSCGCGANNNSELCDCDDGKPEDYEEYELELGNSYGAEDLEKLQKILDEFELDDYEEQLNGMGVGTENFDEFDEFDEFDDYDYEDSF